MDLHPSNLVAAYTVAHPDSMIMRNRAGISLDTTKKQVDKIKACTRAKAVPHTLHHYEHVEAFPRSYEMLVDDLRTG